MTTQPSLGETLTVLITDAMDYRVHPDLINTMCKRGADINGGVGFPGDGGILHYLAWQTTIASLPLLSYGDTFPHIHQAYIEVLMKHGIDWGMKNAKGETAHDLAVKSEHPHPEWFKPAEKTEETANV